MSAMPELSSSYKAVTVKYFARFLGGKAIEMADDTPYRKLRATCSWALIEFMHVIDHAGIVLTDHELNRMQYAGNAYILSYAALAKQAVDRSEMQWRLRPKLHGFDHLLDDCADIKWSLSLLGADP